jgi:hypothetical protein
MKVPSIRTQREGEGSASGLSVVIDGDKGEVRNSEFCVQRKSERAG